MTLTKEEFELYVKFLRGERDGYAQFTVWGKEIVAQITHHVRGLSDICVALALWADMAEEERQESAARIVSELDAASELLAGSTFKLQSMLCSMSQSMTEHHHRTERERGNPAPTYESVFGEGGPNDDAT